MTDLIARLEALTGPDREVDAEIYGAAWSEPPPAVDIEDWVPRYTESLDAALTLVPESWRWCVRSRDKGEVGDFARVESPDYDGVSWSAGGETGYDHLAGIEAMARAATPAIATCIAAVRAIEARHET